LITLTVDGDSPFDKNDQLLKTSRQQSINMVVQFNAADFQQLGLELAGFDLRRQGRVNDKTNTERFRSQYYNNGSTEGIGLARPAGAMRLAFHPDLTNK
jgi:hypothetical protein